jgi:hypothetical protein
MSMHDCPEALYWVQMRAICRQLDQMDATAGLRKPVFDGVTSMVRCGVPDLVNDRFSGIMGLEFLQELHCAASFHSDDLDKRCIEVL